MSYTLAAAAAATGLSKKTILRAIKDGTIAGTRDERGEWHVEAAELDRLNPAQPERTDDIEELGAQIEALLRRAGDRLRQQLEETRRNRGDEGDRSQVLVLADRQRGR
jgi:excisionase family DNA binding protein